MSKNIEQVFVANPITSNSSLDLMYFGQSPYGPTDDAAMTYANFSLQFLAANPTNHGVLIGTGTNTVHSVVLTAGEVLIGTTASDPVGATLTAGTNININSASGAITISATGSASFSWNDVATSPQALAVNQGYITDNGASLVTYTLPTTSAVGSVIEISGKSSGGWSITYTTNQIIHIGNQSTTITTGSLSSTNQWDSVKLVCVTANLVWNVVSGVGNFTVV